MIDIKFLRENPEVVKENIRKKFQDEKLSLVDEVIALDAESRKAKHEADDLRASRNRISKEIEKKKTTKNQKQNFQRNRCTDVSGQKGRGRSQESRSSCRC